MSNWITLIFLSLFSLTSFARSAKVIHIEDNYGFNDRWVKLSKKEDASIRKLLKLLNRSRTARKVIGRATKKAHAKGLTLMDVIEGSENSLLDTTLVRRFHPKTPSKVVYETKSKVFLNRSLSVLDGALDLIHELTHFSFRKPFNPYESKFKLDEFVHSTVEGRGGEVDAYIIECRVLFELFPKSTHGQTSCGRIVSKKTGKISKALAVEEFYKVGGHFKDFATALKGHELSPFDFPMVNQQESLFISSAYGVPYPLAAVQEYVSIMDRVCTNDKRRLSIMEYNTGRSPASKSSGRELASLRKSFSSRCEFFQN